MSLFEDDPGLIRRQEGQVREQAERAHAMRRRIESIHGVGVSPSRGVTVTVDSAGTLLALAIDDAPTELCDAIVAAYAARAATSANRLSPPPRTLSVIPSRASSACVRYTVFLPPTSHWPRPRIPGCISGGSERV